MIDGHRADFPCFHQPRIGHIEIEIPWNQLGRKAVVVKVEGVHVLAYAKYQVRPCPVNIDRSPAF